MFRPIRQTQVNTDTDEEHASRRYGRAVKVDPEYADQQLREATKEYDWTRTTADAYVAQIRVAVFDAMGKGKVIRFDRFDDLKPFIEKANLPMKTEIENALAEAWAKSSYQRCAAYDREVLDVFHQEGHLDEANWQTYYAIIENLGGRK